MDKLEKYIIDHREQLDAREPGNKLWDRIEKDLDQTGGRKWLNTGFLWKAASIILFATVIGLLLEHNGIFQREEQVAQADINEIDFAEVENYYVSLIQVRQNEIIEFIDQYTELDNRFLNDLNKLDEKYEQLKAELNVTYCDKILNAMILNLQFQIEVLNQQMEIIENIKNMREDETVNI